jgi:hypothetical protein
MTSKKIIERLKHQNWYVKCETEHEVALVLNACLDAKINWYHGESPSCVPEQILENKPLFIEQYNGYGYGCGLA